jgi:hypothetical protein
MVKIEIVNKFRCGFYVFLGLSETQQNFWFQLEFPNTKTPLYTRKGAL